MIFGSCPMIRRLSDFKLSLLWKELLSSESIKDLGVTFDPTLSFGNQILATVSSCMGKLAQINRPKHAFNSDLLVTIINALVFSKLYYCSTVWSSTTAYNVQKLQLVQNFAARIVNGTYKFEHITPSLKNLKWLPVKKQLYLRDADFAFKCMTGCAPTYLTSQFVKSLIKATNIKQNHKKLTTTEYSPVQNRCWSSKTMQILKLCESHANLRKLWGQSF